MFDRNKVLFNQAVSVQSIPLPVGLKHITVPSTTPKINSVLLGLQNKAMCLDHTLSSCETWVLLIAFLKKTTVCFIYISSDNN